jgi:hypothetical protein
LSFTILIKIIKKIKIKVIIIASLPLLLKLYTSEGKNNKNAPIDIKKILE